MANRWWIYQRERFPVFKHGILILAFSLSAVGYSALLRGTMVPARLVGSALIAFLTLFLFFLQLRIADEFKDFEEDARYRPYRPVPRGLVTLPELAIGAIAAAAIQLGLAISQGWSLVLVLALVWAYLLLMFKEFFVSRWLKSQPLAYLLSHAVIMPLMALYAGACDWLTTDAWPPQEFSWFLGISFFNSLAIEMGRKMRAPEQEETGVETYTMLWGRSKAVALWLLVLTVMLLAAMAAGQAIAFPLTVTGVALGVLVLAIALAAQFLRRPQKRWAKQFEILTGLATLLVYGVVGIVPLLTVN